MTAFCVVFLLLIAALLGGRYCCEFVSGFACVFGFLHNFVGTHTQLHVLFFYPCVFVARPSHTPAHPLTPTHALVCALVFDHTFFM